MNKMENWHDLAEELAAKAIYYQGINDEAVLNAIKKVPRHLFVPKEYQESAYYDAPLPIGDEQTISQPSMVARMTALLQVKKGDRVLEIGTGSGYQAAVLARMGVRVTTIERIEILAEKAKNILDTLGCKVECLIGDGRLGYPQNAPYQGIIVTAGAQKVENSWLEQLAEGGRLVVPLVVKESIECLLVRKKQPEGKYDDTWYDYCRFVPLLKGVKKK